MTAIAVSAGLGLVGLVALAFIAHYAYKVIRTAFWEVDH